MPHNGDELMAGAGRVELCGVGARFAGLPAVAAFVGGGADGPAGANDVGETADRWLAPELAPVVPFKILSSKYFKEKKCALSVIYLADER